MVKKGASRPTKPKSWPVYAGVGAVCLISLLALLCFASAVLCRVDIPHTLYAGLATALCGISCLLGGVVFGCSAGERGLAHGAVVGVCLFAVLWLAGMLSGQIGFTAFAAIRLAIFVAAGAAGGYWGVLRRGKKHRRRPG